MKNTNEEEQSNMRGMCSVAQWSTCSQVVQATTNTLSNHHSPAHMGYAPENDQHPVGAHASKRRTCTAPCQCTAPCTMEPCNS